MKKLIPVIIVAVLCVGGVLGGFWWQNHKTDASAENNTELSKIQKITTKNLDAEYPETPRAVVKFFNNIITCYYDEDWTEEEIRQLAGQAWELFDPELQENNESLEQYVSNVKSDAANYRSRKRTISQTDVCDSNQVQYRTDKDKGDDLAYVSASYFVKEGNSFDNTYEMYVLRKQEDGRWKILVFYQIDKAQSSEED